MIKSLRNLTDPGCEQTIPTSRSLRENHESQHHSESKQNAGTSAAFGIEKWLLRRLLKRLGGLPVRLELPGGLEVQPSAKKQPLNTIKIRDRRTMWTLIFDPLFQFGEAYARGAIEIEGDLVESLTAIFGLTNRRSNLHRRWADFLRNPRSNTRLGSRKNIHHHYDIGNEFYRLWLDKNMQYTCAYFARPEFTLEQAQIAKLDHVCRKLGLRPGMTVVEAGCGWGGLALHMARQYGVNVRAYNISCEQINWAKTQAKRKRLNGKVEFILDDWRNIRGTCDAFVSVGMLEHVGVKSFKQLGDTIDNCLKPGGIGLIHTIGQNFPRPLNRWIERRIFPGAYPPTLKQMMQIFEGPEFSILDIENLRLHYAATLRHWLNRFENASDQVSHCFDERFIRMWRLYLAGSVAAFESSCLQLFQVVFAHGNSNRVPRTRQHLYDTGYNRLERVIKLRNENRLDVSGSTKNYERWPHNNWNSQNKDGCFSCIRNS